MRTEPRWLWISLFLAFPVWAAGESSGVLISDAPLYKQPDTTAAQAGTLKKETPVAVKRRDSGWYQVGTEQFGEGWLQLFNLRFQRTASRPGKSGVASLLATVRGGHSDVTSATGVRGLSAEDIRQSTPDFTRLAALDTFAANGDDAKKFAEQGGLKAKPAASR